MPVGEADDGSCTWTLPFTQVTQIEFLVPRLDLVRVPAVPRIWGAHQQMEDLCWCLSLKCNYLPFIYTPHLKL